MGDFKRSPSKIWWASESLEWCEVSSSSESPRSQDSGFSDTPEASPLTTDLRANRNNDSSSLITQNLLKNSSSRNKQNLSNNLTPEKCNKTPFNTNNTSYYTKHLPSTKVNRNLFKACSAGVQEFTKDVVNVSRNQYSEDGAKTTSTSTSSSSPFPSSSCSDSQPKQCVQRNVSSAKEILHHRQISLREYGTNNYSNNDDDGYRNNNTYNSRVSNRRVTAKAVEDNSRFLNDCSLSSDCESELECLFDESLNAPQHTSTPKRAGQPMRRSKKQCAAGTKLPLNCFLKYDEHDQGVLSSINSKEIEANDMCLKKWFSETRQSYDPECMITLQCKSIASELSKKVASVAEQITANLRNILNHSYCIQMEYRKLNSEQIQVGPLSQSLAGNIVNYYENFAKSDVGTLDNVAVSREYDGTPKSFPTNSLEVVAKCFNDWQLKHQDILVREATLLVDRLANPRSEFDVKATTTGLTSISLRYENLIEIFSKLDIIPVLLVLCEKCEGSSSRNLLLRALSTICGNSLAVRQFEKFSGLEIVCATIAEETRPEPERAEAVALLAQVTAPWIEDNHCINGLEQFSDTLVKSLTEFANCTKCCQNLLLSAAALTNLSSMDANCLKYMIQFQTVKVLLSAIDRRGPRVTIYLLEQVTSLIANITASELGREQLVRLEVHVVLLKLLKINKSTNKKTEDVERRLQQKSVIALSRLCGYETAALEIVKLGGVEKLVKMCRDKNERFHSDAVLVASLATLRKITAVCGTGVISSEDVQELVEPKLLDSFLAYSTQSESYV